MVGFEWRHPRPSRLDLLIRNLRLSRGEFRLTFKTLMVGFEWRHPRPLRPSRGEFHLTFGGTISKILNFKFFGGKIF
jgi:hypothetical protein